MQLEQAIEQTAEVLAGAVSIYQYNAENEQQADSSEWLAYRHKLSQALPLVPELAHLQQCFGLTEQDLLLLLLAYLPELDNRFAQLFGQLQDGLIYPELDLLLNLVVSNHAEKQTLYKRLLSDHPLTRYELLTLVHSNTLRSACQLNFEITRYLMAITNLNTACDGWLRLLTSKLELVPRLTDADLLDEQGRVSSVVIVRGPLACGKQSAATEVSYQQQRLCFQLQNPSEQPLDLAQWQQIWRFCVMQQANLIWRGGIGKWKKCFNEIVEHFAHTNSQLFLLEKAQAADIAQVLHLLPDIATSKIDLSLASATFAQQVWHYYQQQQLPTDLITKANSGELSAQLLFASCQDKPVRPSKQNLEYANVLHPNLQREQVLLNKTNQDQLDALLLRYQHKDILATQLAQLDYQTGVVSLISGPPGTGKTCLAQLISSELGVPLIQANLAHLASKWIGETEKNLEQLLNFAQQQAAVLFFDEADALFAKRNSVASSQDKNANLLVSYLLQKMESYQGVMVLATNLKANIDSAFFRRCHFYFELDNPSAELRLRLWQHYLPTCIELAADIQLELLASQFLLNGAQIKQVLQQACLTQITHAPQQQQWALSKADLAQAIKHELLKQGDEIHGNSLTYQNKSRVEHPQITLLNQWVGQ